MALGEDLESSSTTYLKDLESFLRVLKNSLFLNPISKNERILMWCQIVDTKILISIKTHEKSNHIHNLTRNDGIAIGRCSQERHC